jgi:mono/diheme cytochrome c family protein
VISRSKLGILIAGIFAAAISAVLLVFFGAYNIGADDHHTPMVAAFIGQLRDRSVEVRSRAIEVHTVSDPSRVAEGASRYAALCAGCHLAPGVTKSAVRAGLYPHPPNLAQEEVQEERRSFWIIKHGIKMSAMPAWGKTLDDATIWEIVSFMRELPAMSPEAYQQLASARGQ